MIKVTFAEPTVPARGTLFVGVTGGVTGKERLTATAKDLDRQSKGALARAVRAARFSGKLGETLAVLAPSGLEELKIVLLGLGHSKDLDSKSLRKLGAKIVQRMRHDGVKEASLVYDPPGRRDRASEAAQLAYGAVLRSYRFDKYFTKKDKEREKASQPAKLSVQVTGATDARRVYKPLDAVARGLEFARNLVSEPGNIIYPESLADECIELRKLGVAVQILDEGHMERLGMGALLGVGQGSARESRLVVMRWNGGPKSKKPVAFVGKGVTFDTGGISIKPSGGMEDMKWDMGGAGAVIGALYALAARKAKVNAVGVVGLVENMPSSTAQRPGDIVTTMSGQTIEVINTDAEGRLVLADAIWYTQAKFKPQIIVDLATLTGAIIVALGHEYAGLYS
ncbi:MAG: leucyl aminopeptidase, partial [Alphaproteobacteria bacterium]|nr:leucyl aminopeptidase [Alphaproteobacteria bacterium]